MIMLYLMVYFEYFFNELLGSVEGEELLE